LTTSSDTRAARGWLDWLPGLLVVVVATAAIVGWLRFSGPPIYCGDGYYHIRYAEILRHEGISRTFPWFQESFLKDHFANFNLWYHVLLMPFTFGDLLLGARLAAILCACLMAAAFYGLVRQLRVPWPAGWVLVLFALAPDFLFRLTFTRPLVLSIAVFLAGLAAIFARRRGLACLLAAIFTHVHCSFHILPAFALLHDLHGNTSGESRLRRFRTTLWTLGGTAVGLVLSPYFPNNLRFWWVANFGVLGRSWSEPDRVRIGTEMMAMRSDDLLIANLGLFAALALAVYLLSRTQPAPAEARTLLVGSIGFLTLTFLSQRFVELWAPLTVALLAVTIRDVRVRRIATAALGIAAAVLLGWSVRTTRAAISAEEGPRFVEAAQWMAAHVPEGETVFNLEWDEFPELFFWDPANRYIIGQDPTFMVTTDRERFRLWNRIREGSIEDVYGPIRETFRCRWVFASTRHRNFLRVAERDPRFVAEWEGRDARVYRLSDELGFEGDWRVVGWYPDPARRLLDAPLLPEPSGPAAEGIEVSTRPAFVDLARLLAVPPLVRDVCGVAETDLLVDAATVVGIAVTTDDEFRVRLDDSVILERSPYREPPPGLPGGPPQSLEDYVSKGSAVPEASAEVTLPPGRHRLTVRSCRVGDDFGFFLSARMPDGRQVPRSIPAPLPQRSGPTPQ
jgi:hypothetical protein